MLNLNNLKRMFPLLILMYLNPCDPAGGGPLRPAAGPVPALLGAASADAASVGAASAAPLTWSVVARLPLPPGRSVQPGVAGPFAGVSGDALIVAGGSNFPDKKPWEGGRKAYVDEVYVLSTRAGAPADAAGAYQWNTAAAFRLPEQVAYGASVTTAEGIVCIGGETAAGFSKKAFLLQWDPLHSLLRYKDLPDLPVALAGAGAALIGHTVYAAGGENASRALACCFSLDLAAPTMWQRLPAVPLAISYSAVVAQAGMVYLIGGRSKTASGVSTLHNTVFRYDPRARTWRQMRSIGDGIHPPHLAAANAVADDDGGILVIGGDDGRIFHELEVINAELADAGSGDARSGGVGVGLQRKLQDRKMALIDAHPGFWRGILRYDVMQDRWTYLGELPVPAPVTTVAVRWGSAIVIPCGEIKPGTRSADILMGTLNTPHP
jgi:N-acetylneuraminic acid mutarotase